MRGVDLVQASQKLHAAFGRDVRVLASPGHEEFALNIRGAGEGVVLLAFAERAGVNVGRVKADRAAYFGVHGGAEGEMAAHADAHGADLPGAVGPLLQVGDDCASVSVIGGDRLVGLDEVAAVGAGLIVGEGYSGGFVLVVDLRHGDDVAVPGEHGAGAADRTRDLEDLREEDDARILSAGCGPDDVGAHRARGCFPNRRTLQRLPSGLLERL